MTIKVHEDIYQGTDEWFKLRCGLLTASEMKLVITPGKMDLANNDKSRSHFYELLAQRITGHVEPSYVSDDMLRGKEDEDEGREKYSEAYAPVKQVGFVTNDKWGFTLGYSPDGLVDDVGTIEIKGRRQKFQMETIFRDEVPEEFMLQIQTGLLVSERKWCDFISYSGGLPMFTKRVSADVAMQAAIVQAAIAFHAKLDAAVKAYSDLIKSEKMRLIPTERRKEMEMFV